MSHYRATWAEHQARNAAQPVDVSADIEARRRRVESAKRFAARMATCRDCDNYRDDDAGNPLDPPCALNIPWNRCQWKRQAASEKPTINEGCMWHD